MATKKKREIIETVGSDMTEPLGEEEAKQREKDTSEAIKASEEAKKPASPVVAASKAPDTIEAGASTSLTSVAQGLGNSASELFAAIHKTAEEHFQIAKLNGHHSVAQAWRGLQQVTTNLEKQLKGKLYHLPLNPETANRFKDPGVPASAGNNSAWRQNRGPV